MSANSAILSTRMNHFQAPVFVAVLVAGLLFCQLRPAWAGVSDFSPGLLRWVEQKYGEVAVERLKIWRGLVKQMAGEVPATRSTADATAAGVQQSLRRTNQFFNQVPYRSDQELWGVSDYWATPAEMLGIYGGDCEDYAIAKYLTLKDLGVPLERLRITYVRQSGSSESHMVLAYYPSPDAEPLILDNLKGDIRRASERPDLQPVFSFNDDDLWSAASNNMVKGGSTQVRLWRQLQDKLEKERRM